MAILFDLDGTLIDTSHDIYDAVHLLLQEEKRPIVPYEYVRPVITFGTKKIIAHAFNLDPLNPIDLAYIQKLEPRVIELYMQTSFKKSLPFPGIDQLLHDIEQIDHSWGIVTNKNFALTEPLLKTAGLLQRSACLVCGDTTANIKPHPEPLLHACKLMQVNPNTCLYIGDSKTDIIAGKAAGMATMAVGFGYVPLDDSIHNWQADYSVNSPTEIFSWIQKWANKDI